MIRGEFAEMKHSILDAITERNWGDEPSENLSEIFQFPMSSVEDINTFSNKLEDKRVRREVVSILA